MAAPTPKARPAPARTQAAPAPPATSPAPIVGPQVAGTPTPQTVPTVTVPVSVPASAPPEAKAGQVNSATLIMGATGSGKSSLLATLAEYVWETWHLVSVLGSSDGGGFPDRVQALIKLGIIWPFRMRTRDDSMGTLSFETCSRATKGWLPERWDRRTGAVQPGVRMIPPITEAHAMHCPNGHLLKTVPYQAMLTPQQCPICKLYTDKANMRVSKAMARTKGFEQIGAVMFDGLTSMLTWMLQDMGQRAGRLELKGEEGAIGGKIQSGEMKFGGNTRSHVGFAQSRAEELVLNSLSIPFLKVPPVFTALTMEVSDEGGLPIIGPKLAGRARTEEAPAWVGNCLEARVVKDDRDNRVFRLYLEEWIDDAGARHLVKHRGAPGTLPPYLDDPPMAGDQATTAFTEFNLGTFFRLLEAGQARTEATLTAKYPDAPGSVDGWQSVGEGGLPPADQLPAPVAAQTAATAAPAAPRAAAPRPGKAKAQPPAAPAPAPAQPPAEPVQAEAAPEVAPDPPAALTAPAETAPPVVAPLAVEAPQAATQAAPQAAPPTPPATAAAAPPTTRPSRPAGMAPPPGTPRRPAPAPRPGGS